MWNISIALDKDQVDVGTITGTFTNTDGTVFSYSERCETNTKAQIKFINNAIAARNAWLSNKTEHSSVENEILSLLEIIGEAV